MKNITSAATNHSSASEHLSFETLKSYAKGSLDISEKQHIDDHLRECNHCSLILSDITFFLEKNQKSTEELDDFLQKNTRRNFNKILANHKKRSKFYVRPLQAVAVVAVLAPLVWLWYQYNNLSQALNQQSPLAINIDTVGREAARYKPSDFSMRPTTLPEAQGTVAQNNLNTPSSKAIASHKKDIEKSVTQPSENQWIAANFAENASWDNMMNLNVRSNNNEKIVVEPIEYAEITDNFHIKWVDGFDPESEKLTIVIYNNKAKKVFSFETSETESVNLKKQNLPDGLYYWVLENENASILQHGKFFLGHKL
ncbi:hypothetical protein SAMN05421780_101241 [Flexibacter flexilis DSM 6793]|uniref:Zinc-finger n=1 Tax=Flexibacter flexilis DSM 6793 TaxID=927664 RepID=A0A1I1DJN8_9BACT|nr:hypothetical protein [Flexibacter flexilis]SFB74656.1 hypothetical protein SAMN05421780_101241 [Flexibacter flexilis DSM 6793]